MKLNKISSVKTLVVKMTKVKDKFKVIIHKKRNKNPNEFEIEYQENGHFKGQGKIPPLLVNKVRAMAFYLGRKNSQTGVTEVDLESFENESTRTLRWRF